MKEAHLYRMDSSDEGTFGCILYDNQLWHTLELPHRNNERSISCIPKGEYICNTRYSPHFKRITFHLQDVESRTYILIHGANFAGDINKGYQSHLNGCIALGKKRGTFPNKYGNRQKAILLSRKAVREFMDLMEGEEFKLFIRDLYV